MRGRLQTSLREILTVRPEDIMMLWISHTDVSRDALDVALARPVSEGGGHVFELPLTLGGKTVERRDARQHDIAVRDGRQGRLVQHAVFVVFLGRLDGLGGQWARRQEVGDCRRSHGFAEEFKLSS